MYHQKHGILSTLLIDHNTSTADIKQERKFSFIINTKIVLHLQFFVVILHKNK